VSERKKGKGQPDKQAENRVISTAKWGEGALVWKKGVGLSKWTGRKERQVRVKQKSPSVALLFYSGGRQDEGPRRVGMMGRKSGRPKNGGKDRRPQRQVTGFVR